MVKNYAFKICLKSVLVTDALSCIEVEEIEGHMDSASWPWVQ